MLQARKLPVASLPVEKLFPALLLLFGLGGAGLILYATRWGAGMMDDSFIYITSAQNFAAGRGLVWPWGDGSLRPLTYFPPLFPLILAAFERIGVGAVAGARWINALAFGANLVLVGLLARRAARSWGFATLAAMLFLFSSVLIEVHSWAMSEPLYLLFALSGLLLLAIYFERQDRRWLAGAAALLGLAFLTRYIGFSLLLAGGLALLIISRSSWPRRLTDLVLFGSAGLLPMAVWMGRSLLVTGSAIDRTAGWRLVTAKQLQKAANTLLAWFLPGGLIDGRELFFVKALLLLALVSAAAWLFLRVRSNDPYEYRPEIAIRWMLVLQVVFHILVLLVSKSFFEPSTPLNDRILSPILPSLLVLLAALLSDAWSWNWRPVRLPARAAVLMLAVLFLGFYASRSAELVPDLHNSGLGFTRRIWHRSPTLEAVRNLPASPIFSNSPAAIYMWTQRPAYPIWDLRMMRHSMQADHAVLVVFKSISLSLYDVTDAELTGGLTLIGAFKDGAIYTAAP